MQNLSNAEAGNVYTVKWMFGRPEIIELMHKYKIVQGSQIEVILQKPDGLIIGVQEARIAMSREVADRIKV